MVGHSWACVICEENTSLLHFLPKKEELRKKWLGLPLEHQQQSLTQSIVPRQHQSYVSGSQLQPIRLHIMNATNE